MSAYRKQLDGKGKALPTLATLQLKDNRRHLKQIFFIAREQEANGTRNKVVGLSCSSAVYCWFFSGDILPSSTL